MSLNRMMRRMVLVAAVGGVLGLGAGAAHAAGPYYPLVGITYLCSYTTPTSSGSVFLTYLSLQGDAYHKTGSVRNVYPSGASNQKPCDLTWDFMVDEGPGTTRFSYTQTQDGINCILKTYGSGVHLVYTCTGSVTQDCWAH